MALSAGARLGPYEILAPLGAGGMGEVYKARDSRLDRTVAIKILPETLAADPQFRDRFDREARTISQLSHPHICTLYDVGEQAGTAYLVMELLDGETLAARLARGALPLNEALTIAVQIASALDKAHRSGITHRDLKPGNIMLTKAGAKLLDFGLAKTAASAVAGEGLSMLPTTPLNVTAQGTILGTFQYMAPEQLEGQEADARTDIFAFGAVLYEMITGKKAFEGKSQASLIAAILDRELPPISAILPLAPPALDRVVGKCLAKDPDRRWQSASDLQDELQWIQQKPGQGAALVNGVSRLNTRARLKWLAAIVVAVVAGSAGTVLFRPAPAEAPEMRFQIVTPDATLEFALSPDGRNLVFRADGRLWLRPLDAETARPLIGTEGGGSPFWSTDSRSLGFFAGGKLKRLDVAGGLLQTLADIRGGNGGATWSAEDVILLGGISGPVERMPAGGGTRDAVTRVDAHQVSHRHPQFLPDGRHFLFFATGTPEVRGVYVGSLESKDTRRVVEADAAGAFVPPNHVLFVRQETLFAQRLNLQRVEAVGEPFPVASPVALDGNTFRPAVSSSLAELLAFRAASIPSRQLTWFDRAGRQVGTVGGPDASGSSVRLSPDGRYAALTRSLGGNTDIWLVELGRDVRRRFTFDSANDGTQVWSPDGSRLVFHSNRTGRYDLYLKPIASDTHEVLLVEFSDSENKNADHWSPDGRFVLYNSINPASTDLWVVPVEGDRKPVAVAQTRFNETSGKFSPDGRWIAYESDETGRNEIYVQRFPGAGPKWQVSTNGGTNAQWRGDGHEVLYTAAGNLLMAVAMTLPAEGTSVQPGVPVPLFTMPAGSGYDVTPDGQRFLINVPTDEAIVPPITVILNWRPMQRAK